MSEDMRTPAQAAMDKLMNETGQRVADRNVEALKVANRALDQNKPPWIDRKVGARPDGGMAHPVDIVRNAMEDARRIVDNFEKETIELESKVARLEAQLDAERAARTSLEKQIAQIVDLVSPR